MRVIAFRKRRWGVEHQQVDHRWSQYRCRGLPLARRKLGLLLDGSLSLSKHCPRLRSLPPIPGPPPASVLRRRAQTGRPKIDQPVMLLVSAGLDLIKRVEGRDLSHGAILPEVITAR